MMKEGKPPGHFDYIEVPAHDHQTFILFSLLINELIRREIPWTWSIDLSSWNEDKKSKRFHPSMKIEKPRGGC